MDIYDKAQRQETYIGADHVHHLFPFEIPDFKNLAKALMERTNGADYSSPNPFCLQIRTNDYLLMHKALKRLFDYCGCIYLLQTIRECKFMRNDQQQYIVLKEKVVDLVQRTEYDLQVEMKYLKIDTQMVETSGDKTLREVLETDKSYHLVFQFGHPDQIY